MTYYEVLGVPETATLEEIKSAFRKKIKIYHPDVNKAPDATQRTIELGEAYEILKNPETRKEYDRLLASQRRRTYSARQASDFDRRQRAAREAAKDYSAINLEEILGRIARFTYETSRAVVYGERNKPALNFGDYVKMGFCGLLLTISVIVAFTGVGAIPASAMIYFTIKAASKNGYFVGLATFIKCTVIADIIVVLVLVYIIMANIPV